MHGICETVDFHHGRNWTLEVAVWDLRRPIATTSRCGSCSAASTDRLLRLRVDRRARSADERVRRCLALRDAGVRAVKLRLHSNDWRIDLPVIEAVRDAVGSDARHHGRREPGLAHARRPDAALGPPTAAAFAQELHRLDVYWLEEPLPTTTSTSTRRSAAAATCASPPARWCDRRPRQERSCSTAASTSFRRTSSSPAASSGCRHLATLADEHGARGARTRGRTGTGCSRTSTRRSRSRRARTSRCPSTPRRGRPSGETGSSRSRSRSPRTGRSHRPPGPGLGVVPDWDALEQYRIG